jgi:Heavy-metal-associated domain
VRVVLQKLDGVESADVSLEKASVEIHLRADNKVTLERIRQVVRNSGYPTRDATITARGRIVEQRGRMMFDLLNGSTLELAEAPKSAAAGVVEITGVSRLQGKSGDRLTIATIR